MHGTGYTVKTQLFEGPLELLLSLVEKRKLPINDISLAAVTDDFIARVETGEELPLGQTASFIFVASTLLLIKSKSLLPTLELTEEEEGSIEDLERRLKLYRRFRGLSRNLGELFGKAPLFGRNPRRKVEDVFFAPDEHTNTKELHGALCALLERIPKEEKAPEAVVRQVVSLEEMIDRLATRVSGAMRTSFRDFAGGSKAGRHEVIVSFLAMLELVKQGILSVRQDNQFSDIEMERYEAREA